MSIPSAVDWEAMHAHYDHPTYQAALELLRFDDVVLDIGAGDLYFSEQMARTVDRVYAIEVNEAILQVGIKSYGAIRSNLIPIHADARTLDFPTDVTVGILLMRHCTCFKLYFEKLRLAGTKRLITNARWHMSVEEIDLFSNRQSFDDLELGWYACSCGAAGFKAGAAEQWRAETDKITYEVFDCPQCK